MELASPPPPLLPLPVASPPCLNCRPSASNRTATFGLIGEGDGAVYSCVGATFIHRNRGCGSVSTPAAMSAVSTFLSDPAKTSQNATAHLHLPPPYSTPSLFPMFPPTRRDISASASTSTASASLSFAFDARNVSAATTTTTTVPQLSSQHHALSTTAATTPTTTTTGSLINRHSPHSVEAASAPRLFPSGAVLQNSSERFSSDAFCSFRQSFPPVGTLMTTAEVGYSTVQQPDFSCPSACSSGSSNESNTHIPPLLATPTPNSRGSSHGRRGLPPLLDSPGCSREDQLVLLPQPQPRRPSAPSSASVTSATSAILPLPVCADRHRTRPLLPFPPTSLPPYFGTARRPFSPARRSSDSTSEEQTGPSSATALLPLPPHLRALTATNSRMVWRQAG